MFESAMMDEIKAVIKAGAATAMTDLEFYQQEIKRWKNSENRMNQIIGKKYYRGKHDILSRVRTVIGEDGRLKEIHNAPNNKIVNNQYTKMVDQKANYLLGKPFKVKTGNKAYEDALKNIFDKKFQRMLQNLGKDSLNGGIGWLYVFYDDQGQLRFKRLRPYEILPFWADEDHTILETVVRLYEIEVYEGQDLKIVEKVEIYKDTGIEYYDLSDDVLVLDVQKEPANYLRNKATGEGFNWIKLPIIPFKYNDEEIPLICKVKSLQDALNAIYADFLNNMQEDSRNTILIIQNYGGENLAEFRQNLAQFGVVKIDSCGDAPGGIDTLQVEVNSENYKVIIDLLKKAIIENAMGYDAKDDRLSGNPNQMNILSMYSDIDLDTNGTETEYQASMEELIFFVNAHLANTGAGSFEGEDLEIVFNRDIMMNEAEVINNVQNSAGVASLETRLSKHPWINDVEAEMKRLKQEQQEEVEREAKAQYGETFSKGGADEK